MSHYREFFTTMGSADFSQFVTFGQLISRSLALYVISVRRTRDLPECVRDFHPLERAMAREPKRGRQ